MKQGSTRRRFIGIAAAAAGLALPSPGGAARATGSRGAPGYVTWRGAALGAPSEMVLHHPDRAAAERLVVRAVAEIARLERIFSLYRPDSALCELNRLGALAAPPPELVALLEACRHFHALSDGVFDPSIQPLWRLYARHFATQGADPSGPVREEVAAALGLVDFDAVAIGRDRIAFGRRGMALTLNGIAQGYITDRIVAMLRAGGVTSTLADLGEVFALGRRGDDRPWRIAIEGAPETVFDLVDRAVATSGTDGFRFAGPGSPSHILDPSSGLSAGRYLSVSVVAPDATTADALSTAFSLAEPDRIAALVRAYPGVEAHPRPRDGEHLLPSVGAASP